MAYEWDDVEKGYRLICEATGVRSQIVSTKESGVQGVTWYSDDLEAKVLYCNRQREKFVQHLTELQMPEGYIQDFLETSRWDLLPNGEEVKDPRIEFPRRKIVQMVPDMLEFPANGLAAVRIFFPHLAQDIQVEVNPGGEVTVAQTEPYLTITSDVPQTFIVRILSTEIVAQPIIVKAV